MGEDVQRLAFFGPDPAVRLSEQSGERQQQARFAGAVRTAQQQELAREQHEAHPVEQLASAPDQSQVFCRQQGVLVIHRRHAYSTIGETGKRHLV
jgi:hypothetical protein